MQPEEQALGKAKNAPEAPQDGMAPTSRNAIQVEHDPEDKAKASGEEKVSPARKKRGAKAANFKPRRKKRGAKAANFKPRRKKPRDAPRRPLSAYNLFFRQERATLIARIDGGNPDADFSLNLDTAVATGKERDDPSAVFQAAARTLADRWKRMTSDDKADYNKSAEEEMKKYRARVIEYETRMVEDARKNSTETPSVPEFFAASQSRALEGASEGSQVTSSSAPWPPPSDVTVFPPGSFPPSTFQGRTAEFSGNGNPSAGFAMGPSPGALAAAGYLNLPAYGATLPSGLVNPADRPGISPQDELLLQELQRLQGQKNQAHLVQALATQLPPHAFSSFAAAGGGGAATNPYQHFLSSQQQTNQLDATFLQREQQLFQDQFAAPPALSQSDLQFLAELIERERLSRLGIFPPR